MLDEAWWVFSRYLFAKGCKMIWDQNKKSVTDWRRNLQIAAVNSWAHHDQVSSGQMLSDATLSERQLIICKGVGADLASEFRAVSPTDIKSTFVVLKITEFPAFCAVLYPYLQWAHLSFTFLNFIWTVPGYYISPPCFLQQQAQRYRSSYSQPGQLLPCLRANVFIADVFASQFIMKFLALTAFVTALLAGSNAAMIEARADICPAICLSAQPDCTPPYCSKGSGDCWSTCCHTTGCY